MVEKEIQGYRCMDCKLIPVGAGNHKVEFCDLLTSDKKIIHVKRYGSSSVLSHLFAQGMVSGILFNEDKSFLIKLSAKLGDELGDEYKEKYTTDYPDPKEYKIIYAVISEHDDKLEIPFFSKINIRNAKKRLEGMGYEVYLYHIPVDPNDVYVPPPKTKKQKKSKK